MTPAQAAQQVVADQRTRWEIERPERERHAREVDGMTGDAYIARFDDPGKEPWTA